MLSANPSMEDCSEHQSFAADEFGEDFSIDVDMLYDIIAEGHGDDSDAVQNGAGASLKTESLDGEMEGYGSQGIGLRNDLVLSDTKKQDMIPNNRVQESPVNGSSANLRDWISLDSSNGAYSAERHDFALPTCGVSSFSQRDNDCLIGGNKFDTRTQQHGGEFELRNPQDIKSQDSLKYHAPGSISSDSYKYGNFGQHTVGTVGLPNQRLCTSLQIPTIDADKNSRGTTSVDALIDFSAVKYETTRTEYPFLPGYNPQYLSDDWKNLEKNREWNFPTESACSSTMMEMNGSGIDEKSTVPLSTYFDLDGWNHGYESNDYASSSQRSNYAQSYIYHEDKVKDEKPEELTVPSISMQHSDMSYSGLPSFRPQQRIDSLIDEKEELTSLSKKACRPSEYIVGSTGNITMMNSLDRHIPQVQPFASGKSRVSKVSPESSHSNLSEKSVVEDDPDICIIEEISHPAPRNTIIPAQRSTMESVGSSKSKSKDDSFYMQLMQDLAQPKTEMNPPDGLLSVSLLRHQKIALSWMVQKETDNARCSGGILADDQGLGKTISTISLILKERPLSHKTSPIKPLTETLNLDDDEDGDVPPVISSTTEHTDAHQLPFNGSPSLVVGKGRPAAGTLIVCPTSVLRQWDDELRNKVTKKANLSVLIYHGSNRTKDPCELAKYDVVLTTYSIVSMEVPKQPRADEYDDEKVKMEVGEGESAEPSSNKKRKHPDKKNKKGVDNSVTESLARPLAKVGWFRVVLDEAQSIKNHRTQVARACWGLRAKRRWCLSGTPIQNAIDDLYSYFRFLKYDPFDAYKMFCSYIKAPISRSPTNGYRKLQTILRTIMLRRTKGTLLDGEPIINLPPKFVELKKVEFSEEERDFYSRLEADSRAQFEEYAAAGTVKQNYVNILLMLLRLRQACDHPCLVKGVDSHSLWSASAEMAKKLRPDEKEHLLRCLGASLAICGLCSDPPEDAVIAKCGHVFCNQCISEHLTGDEHNCPNSNCKIRLSLSSVFSRNTLSSSLLGHPCKDGSDKTEETKELPSANLLYSSSKIKAALEVLKTLSGTPGCTLGNTTTVKIPSEPLQDGTESPNIAGEQSSFNSSLKVGQKAIVFSQWTRMLDLLEDCLKHSSIQYRRLDGTMSVIARDKAVKDFNTLPEVTVMIMSLKAASLGLNMVAACHVMLLDLWWNPTTEDQAIDRAHRIGQTRPVTVLRLTVKDTVEDRILALQQKKREMVAAAFGEDGTGGGQTRLTEADLKYLFMT